MASESGRVMRETFYVQREKRFRCRFKFHVSHFRHDATHITQHASFAASKHLMHRRLVRRFDDHFINVDVRWAGCGPDDGFRHVFAD